MERKLPVILKRIWGIVRAIYLMLRKLGVSNKRKLLLDLNLMMMKRGKIASKAISNLMFHHHNASSSSAPTDYEFSCSDTPNYYPFHLNKRRHHHHNYHFFTNCAQSPPQTLDDDVAILEILNNNDVASPTVMIRQLRITDSPFPLKDVEEDHTDDHVDEAAEKFINNFYKDLRLQQIIIN